MSCIVGFFVNFLFNLSDLRCVFAVLNVKWRVGKEYGFLS